jgi:hypothetical protein
MSKSQMQARVFFDQALAIVMCEALALPLSASQRAPRVRIHVAPIEP